jgi:hypothetical protein
MKITTTKTSHIDSALRKSLLKAVSADDASVQNLWSPNGVGIVGITASRMTSIVSDLKAELPVPSDVVVGLEILLEHADSTHERVWLDAPAARVLNREMERLGASWFEPVEGSPIPKIAGLVI